MTRESDRPSPEQLAAFADGELAGEERTRVERWLAEDPTAAAEVDGWRRLAGLWREASPPEPAPAAWDQTLSRIEAALPASRRPAARPRPWRTWALLVAAAALVGVLLLGRPFPGTRPVISPDGSEEGTLPVAGPQDVTILSMDACDTDALVVGQPPVTGDINLAEHGDVQLLDQKNPEIRLEDWAAPMIVDPLVLANEPKDED
jgi:anti-sigma factor RsiW